MRSTCSDVREKTRPCVDVGTFSALRTAGSQPCASSYASLTSPASILCCSFATWSVGADVEYAMASCSARLVICAPAAAPNTATPSAAHAAREIRKLASWWLGELAIEFTHPPTRQLANFANN